MRQLKSFYLRTYGCQMNELDSEMMVGQLLKRGLVRTDDEESADLLLFNTCSIRDLAERKVMGKLGKLGQLERIRSKKAVIGVTGCMANAKKENLLRKLPHVDFVLGTNNISDLNSVLDEVTTTNRRLLLASDQFEENLNYLEAERDDKIKAFVSIIRGCDKFCTYCVVPYTRGQEVSRPMQSILEECRLLVDKGYQEITLLGQNVNSYGKDCGSTRFHDLLYEIDKIQGLKRVRFMTSHPVDITKELMVAIRDLPTLCEFVHFPLQAGSDRILKKMHRIYTVSQYREKVALLRELVPHVALGTDMIVGFPTETQEEFEESVRLYREIDFSVGFLFAYSARKGTPAMRWKDDVPEEIKQERLQTLLQLQSELSAKHFTSLIGSTVEVLVERKNRDDKQLKGRTRCWKNVIFEGDEQLVGTLQQVEIHGFAHQTLLGRKTAP